MGTVGTLNPKPSTIWVHGPLGYVQNPVVPNMYCFKEWSL